MDTATFRLSYATNTTDVADSVQLVFGHIARIAGTLLVAYHSDLYHDAMWLRDNVKGSSYRFIWSASDTGTAIGEDSIAAYRQFKFLFEVTCVDGETMLGITDLTGLDRETINAALSRHVAAMEGAKFI